MSYEKGQAIYVLSLKNKRGKWMTFEKIDPDGVYLRFGLGLWRMKWGDKYKFYDYEIKDNEK